MKKKVRNKNKKKWKKKNKKNKLEYKVIRNNSFDVL
jgi:hypothetical protein